MAKQNTKRPTTKTEQLVLRLTKETTAQLAKIVASAPFKTTRVAVIEHLIAEASNKVKEKRS